jgi:hypothetical protein
MMNDQDVTSMLTAAIVVISPTENARRGWRVVPYFSLKAGRRHETSQACGGRLKLCWLNVGRNGGVWKMIGVNWFSKSAEPKNNR